MIKNKSVFLNLHRSINKTLTGLTNLVKDNIYTIKYLSEVMELPACDTDTDTIK